MKIYTRESKRSATYCDAFQVSKQAWMGKDNKLRFEVGWKRGNATEDFYFFSFEDIARIVHLDLTHTYFYGRLRLHPTPWLPYWWLPLCTVSGHKVHGR
eukprot:g38507.t1